MNDRNRRSAAEVMANAARVVKAAVNIVRAAIAGGLHGAAAAAAKELLPTIIKFAVGVLIAIIVIPMFVISAMIYFPPWFQKNVSCPVLVSHNGGAASSFLCSGSACSVWRQTGFIRSSICAHWRRRNQMSVEKNGVYQILLCGPAGSSPRRSYAVLGSVMVFPMTTYPAQPKKLSWM